MLEGVVLAGTGKKAILDGYSSAGKTGTAQKIDPSTGRYSKSHYIASFGGFAPVNNPAITVLVVLDSPVGRHEGGQVSAPVFARVAQQVLGYMNVPHDVPFQDPKRLLLRAKARDDDAAEGSPDYVADEIESPPPDKALLSEATKPLFAAPATLPSTPSPMMMQTPANPRNGTVVLDTAGGVAVPDFWGKPLRTVMEEAESAGLELEASGSGVGREQSPPAGSRLPPGGHVTVKFGR